MYIQAKGATEESVKENCYYKKGQSTEAKPTASFNIGDEIILKAGRDYDLENAHYINNVKKGTATVKIEGNGFFGNSKSIRYKINQKDIKWWNGN